MPSDWFQHDATASSDNKILQLEVEFGEAGYCRYFKTLEWLYQNADGSVDVSSDGSFDHRALALYLRLTQEEVHTFIDRCIELGLLTIEDDLLFSDRLREQKRKQIAKSIQAKYAVEARERRRIKRRNKPFLSDDVSDDVSDVHRVEESRVEENRIDKNICISANTEILEEFDDFVLWLNSRNIFPSRKVITDAARKKWKSRRTKYSAGDIKKAFANLVNEPDKWKINNNGGRTLAWWLHSDERIEDMLHCHEKKITGSKNKIAAIIYPSSL